MRPSGGFRGLISGMAVGENTLVAKLKSPKPAQASLKVTNYPITGPILSGPHLTPYECRTVESGLGEPLDANCSAKQKIEYFYRASNNTFKPLANPTGPRPSDLVTTTTNDGKTVPYIVRVESGTINRSIYRIAILDDPNPETASINGDQANGRRAGWNRKLAVSFGGGAGTQYNQGINQATAALEPSLSLARLRFHDLDRTGQSAARQRGAAGRDADDAQGVFHRALRRAEMDRRQWRVGRRDPAAGDHANLSRACSTACSRRYRSRIRRCTRRTAGCCRISGARPITAVWTDAKKTAVEGYTKGTCAAWERSFVPVLTATNARGCALNDASKVYDPVKNPKGARCTMQEMRVNIYGRDPKTGFARKPQDNVGLQYGLAALNDGAISVDEFLDLNEKIGGNDIDGNFIAQRAVGDPIALRAIYASGLINSGGGGLGQRADPALASLHRRHRRHPRPPSRPDDPRAPGEGQRPIRQSGDLDRACARRGIKPAQNRRRRPCGALAGHDEQMARRHGGRSGAALDRQGGHAQTGRCG